MPRFLSPASTRYALLSATLGTAALLATLPSSAMAQTVIRACYVPNSGTVYRVGAPNTAPNCLQPSHVPFQWTDGADAFAALEQAVKKTDAAAGDVTGVFSNLTVARLLGRALATTPPTEGQVLAWNAGSNQWEPRAVAGGGGGVTAHGQLTGLTADDHPQYLLTQGVRNSVNGFAVTGTLGQGTIPTTGTGLRMMWYPGKAAFRAGMVEGDEWNDPHVGPFSFALGRNSRAAHPHSFVAGLNSSSSGSYALAHGLHVNAGEFAFGLGSDVNAVGRHSLALGSVVSASGQFSVAMGAGSSASAIHAQAFGHEASATAPHAYARGTDVQAKHPYAVVFGSGSSSTGAYSLTVGAQNSAGEYSLAVGREVSAGNDAFAFGASTTAGGKGSMAFGSATSTAGAFALAGGLDSYASGSHSFAFGNSTNATATNAVAIGPNASAEGVTSFALGHGARSTAMGAFALGRGARALNAGAMVLSDDNAPVVVSSSSAHQFTARFTGGYRLFTNTALTTGCSIAAGGGAWNCTSDRNTKTAVADVDGESLLGKLRALPISTWEYHTERGARHLGPMAQDFRAAFGLGSDEKTIGVLDASGVALAAAQALEARTRALQSENAQLRQQNETLLERLARLEQAVTALEVQLQRQR